MFPSLASRIAALGAVIMIALLALMSMLMDASRQTRDSFLLVTHSAQVIEEVGDALVALRDAESGQRGFILTGDGRFVETFEQEVRTARLSMETVERLTRDNPIQNGRARELSAMIGQRITVMRAPLELARKGSFDEARALVTQGRGRELMESIAFHADGFLDEEHALRSNRALAARNKLDRVKSLAVIGGPLLIGLVLLVSLLVIRGIRRPVGILQEAMSALGHGDRHARIDARMGSREFSRLARGYNAMVDQIETALTEQARSESRLQAAHGELVRSSEVLRDRGEAIEMLGGMAHRMQAARTDDELAQVISLFVPRVLPGIAGALYAHNNSRNLLIPIAGWGGFDAGRDGFAPDQCWALRRGQSHVVPQAGADIICAHLDDQTGAYHCEPLLAGGEVIGTLYLQGQVGDENRFRLTVMAENIASALVNHRLQRGLREQTIRDPLTGLFNRRYMEEALALEIARAARAGTSLSLVMCDVDHFKRFNDEFGHDAGDAVLQAVATEMRSRFREGDVVCRFGGEEFTIIAPGTSAAELMGRVEHVRRSITEISLRHDNRTLGSTSMSFGIADWNPLMDRQGAMLLKAADVALYRAKREGRNRAVVELREVA